MTTFLFDTSTLIEIERGTATALPASFEWATSAITLAELNVGVLRATSSRARNRRMTTYLRAAERVVLPFDETTARTFAELYAWARESGVAPSVSDGIIAATAATNGFPLVTFDHGFERIADFEGLELVLL